MGFFGQVIEEEELLELPIPEEYYLHVTQVCIAPECLDNRKLPGPIVIYAKTTNEEKEYAVAVLNPSQNVYHASLSLEFGTEDSPITLRASKCAVHVTGKWTWDEDCGQEHDSEVHSDCDDGSDCAEEEDQESDEEEDEAPMLVEIEELPSSKIISAKCSASTDVKRLLSEIPSSSSQEHHSSHQISAHNEPSIKKPRVEGALKEPNRSIHALKPWKVYPDCDEGIAVPIPKTVKKAGGLEITDYIIGNGDVPRAGAVVKILYEGLFPNGHVFDQKQKRKSPFSFRKGTGQVISGMDKGIDGMKIGGAREIVIPPHLG